ncbi:hypothetical protein AZI09_00245 [Levilactobacillus brevis]|nr:hypothetical protein [Levilactobacillus brevis]ARN89126.1 hypothetical protein AZI09_00245 [Levilactobacillus brevis]
MAKKLTTEEVANRVSIATDNKIELIGEYVNIRKHALFHCKVCDYKWTTGPQGIYSGKTGCPKCAGCERKDTATFKQYVFNQVGDEYIVLGEFKTSKTPIKMKHMLCGGVFTPQPGNFLNNHTRCPKCNGHPQLNTLLFKLRIKRLVNTEYSVLEAYKSSHTPILMRHNKCWKQFKMTPDAFSQGQRCPSCNGTPKKTTGYFQHEVYILVQKEYTVLGDYISSSTLIKMKHNKCKNIYDVRPNDFLKGNRCPKCAGLTPKSTESFKTELRSLYDDQYILLEKYINDKTPILVRHNKCGLLFTPTPNNLLSNHGCPKCAGVLHKNTAMFKDEIKTKFNDEFIVTGEYIDGRTSITIIHKKCNHEFITVPHEMLHRGSCPYCHQSIGERVISKYLEERNISFRPQYRFSECRYKEPLPFDFAVFIHDEIKYLIEFQGVQHYQKWWRDKKNDTFKLRRLRDKIKRDFCRQHNYELIEIPCHKASLSYKQTTELVAKYLDDYFA